jgi:phosphoribosyl 1,2-cyclic phosphodiesterase
MGPNKVTVNFYGKKDTRQRLSEVLSGQQQYPNFPVEWGDMPCDKVYHELSRLESRSLQLGKAKVTYQELNHPDEVFAYRIEVDGKAFVLATDTEHRDFPDPRLVKLAKNADILYYDAQYTPEEYTGKKGMAKIDWGHSTYEWGVRNALAAGVKTLVLGHHDPGRSDEGLEEILMSAKRFCDEQHSPNSMDIVMGYDGLEQYL